MASLYNSIRPHSGTLAKFVEYIKMERIAQSEIRFVDDDTDVSSAQVGIEPMTWTFPASTARATFVATFPGAVEIATAVSHH